MVVTLLLFVWLFAVAPGLITKAKDVGGEVVQTLIALAVAGWVFGSVIQLLKYGAITAPCCQ